MDIATGVRRNGRMLPSHVTRAFAAAPGGVLTVPELRVLGHHRLEVAAWAAERLTDRLHHGVYRDAVAPVPPEQRLHAATRYLALRARPDEPPAVMSGCASLGAVGWPASPFAARRWPWSAARRPRGVEGVLTVRRTDMSKVRTVEHRGVLLAECARGIADAALDAGVDDGTLRRAVDDVRNRRMLHLHEAVAVWAAVNHVGARRLLAMYHDGVFDQESDGERDAFRLLFARRHPEPDCQVVLLGRLRLPPLPPQPPRRLPLRTLVPAG